MNIRKLSMIVVTGAAMLIAGAAIGQEATSQPSETPRVTSLEQTTSRPLSSRFESYRGNRRDRGDRNERRNGQNSQSNNNSTAPSSAQTLYEQVGSRNIFIRGNQQTPEPVMNQGPSISADQQYRMQQETQLMLTGVSLADNGKIALLENRSDYSVRKVMIGDSIANGKIVNITLDSLDYKDNNGRLVRVGVGYNLSGGDVWGMQGSSSSGSGTPSTRPAAGGPRLPGESMEDYLKRRRSAEIAH